MNLKLKAITQGPPERNADGLKISSVRAGSQIIDQIFWELLKILKNKSGLTELDLAKSIRKLAKQMGAGSMAFPPIVAFGKGSAEIHHFAANKKIGKNNFLMLDYGVKVNGFCSDFTRTLFLGNPNKFQRHIYNVVLKSQSATIRKIIPGKLSDEIDFTARHIINSAGYGKYFTHGTGHGVGRKIHEPPNFKTHTNDILRYHDIVTVEPGIYLPKKFGVRIEDMILVGSKPQIFSKIPTDFKNMVMAI